jgi:hypothetical protein
MPVISLRSRLGAPAMLSSANRCAYASLLLVLASALPWPRRRIGLGPGLRFRLPAGPNRSTAEPTASPPHAPFDMARVAATRDPATSHDHSLVAGRVYCDPPLESMAEASARSISCAVQSFGGACDLHHHVRAEGRRVPGDCVARPSARPRTATSPDVSVPECVRRVCTEFVARVHLATALIESPDA